MGRDARGYVGPRWPEAALFVGVPVFIFHGKVTSRAACRMQIKSSSSSSKKQHEMKFLARYLFESEQTALGRKVHRPKTGVGRKVLFKQHTSASLIKSFPPISTSKNGSFSHHPGVALTSHCAKKDKSASDLRHGHMVFLDTLQWNIWIVNTLLLILHILKRLFTVETPLQVHFQISSSILRDDSWKWWHHHLQLPMLQMHNIRIFLRIALSLLHAMVLTLPMTVLTFLEASSPTSLATEKPTLTTRLPNRKMAHRSFPLECGATT